MPNVAVVPEAAVLKTRPLAATALSCMLFFCLLTRTASSLAQASGTPSALVTRYEAPAGCPPASRLEALIRRYLVQAPADPGRAVSVSIERLPEGAWRMRVALPSERLGVLRERVLTSEKGCAELVQAAAVIIAIVIEGKEEVEAWTSGEELPATDAADQATSQFDEREPLPERVEPRPAEPESSPATTEPDPTSAPPLSFAARLAPVLDVGTFPEMELGGELAFLLRFGRLGVRLSGLLLRKQQQRFDELPDAGADYSLWLGGASFDYAPYETNALELWVSLGAEAGLLRGQAVRLEDARSRSTPWIAATIKTSAVLLPADWLALVFEPGLTVPLRRPGFVVADYGTLHRPSNPVFRGTVGIELRF